MWSAQASDGLRKMTMAEIEEGIIRDCELREKLQEKLTMCETRLWHLASVLSQMTHNKDPDVHFPLVEWRDALEKFEAYWRTRKDGL